jgi:serine/threonine protein kinase/Flp pilus assembly protein TadD
MRAEIPTTQHTVMVDHTSRPRTDVLDVTPDVIEKKGIEFNSDVASVATIRPSRDGEVSPRHGDEKLGRIFTIATVFAIETRSAMWVEVRVNDRRRSEQLRANDGKTGADHSADSRWVQDEENEHTVSVSDAVCPPTVIPTDNPDTVGDYRILGTLGEGGMGIVYEAEQSSPRRRVALKVMRRGHTVDEVHARMFRHEAQTLARLRHPKIAAIYESGHTVDGHDFFAMELVQGQTLASWLDGRIMPVTADELRTRLRLFHSLCEPIHYAHQRGVIHRDLKPANVMVTEDGTGQTSSAETSSREVKILDFGLARIADPDMEAATMMSEVGVIRGTLPYMSPEQTRSDIDAVDVRTDVYALGVILYEMVTGRRPYDLDSSSLVDAVRVICEEPPLPLNEASRPGVPLDKDLETIVGKALAKEPDQRYGSVSELAEDIDRYLGARPILARRPSASYRAKKFVQRHRAGVAAAALVVVAIVAGVVGITVGLVRAKNAEADARRQAATSAKVSQFLADMLASVDAQQVGRLMMNDLERRVADAATARGEAAESAVEAFRDLTRQVSGTDAGRRLVDDAILSRAGMAVSERFGDEPRVAGRLEHTLAETYERFGLYETALEHARRAATIRQTAFGSATADVLRSESLIGLLHYRLGHYENAERLLESVLFRQRPILGDDHPDVFRSAVHLSWVLIEDGRYEDAERILKDVLERQLRVVGEEHRDTATTMNSLAVVYTDQQRFAEAEALHSEVLAIRSRVLGPTDPDTLKSMTNLAILSYYQGRLDDASALFQDVLDIQIQTLGPDHPVTLGSTNNLAVIYQRLGRLDEAQRLHERALETKTRVLGENHPETLSSGYNLAIVLTAQGRLEDAGRLHQQTLEARRRTLGRDSPSTLDSLCAVAGVAALQGDRAEALRRLGEAIDLGYAEAESLAGDDDFASLRELPEFVNLVERARQNAVAADNS